jgi:nucleoside-triphosphatase THEP1
VRQDHRYQKSGGYLKSFKEKPDKTLITVTPANRDGLPDRILEMLRTGCL